MATTADAPVVVGVDHSELSLTATRLAAREAASQGRPLRVVHAFNWSVRPGGTPDSGLRVPAEQLTARAAEVAVRVEPGLTVVRGLAEGPAVPTLLRESSLAALLVLGDGGLDSYTCMPVNATAVQVAARAGCSVLVARERPAPPGTVLAAVDGTPSSSGVLDLAFDIAHRHGSGVSAVQVDEDTGDGDEGAPGGLRQPDPAGTERLIELLRPWRQRYPSVPTSAEFLIGTPIRLLVARSRTAELVVVGTRGAQPWRGGLGEVSQGLLHHAPVPVAVVRTTHQLYVQ